MGQGLCRVDRLSGRHPNSALPAFTGRDKILILNGIVRSLVVAGTANGSQLLELHRSGRDAPIGCVAFSGNQINERRRNRSPFRADPSPFSGRQQRMTAGCAAARANGSPEENARACSRQYGVRIPAPRPFHRLSGDRPSVCPGWGAGPPRVGSCVRDGKSPPYVMAGRTRNLPESYKGDARGIVRKLTLRDSFPWVNRGRCAVSISLV